MDDKTPTPEEINDYLNKLIAKLKQRPQWELEQELGRMLMRHIDTFTPEELKRYNELQDLLSKNEQSKE